MGRFMSQDWDRYTSWTWFDFWKENKRKYKMSDPESTKLINRFCKRCHDLVLENPDGIRFPFGTFMVAGMKGDFKDISRSTKDRRIDYRNLKTDQVVYTIRYIFGKTRGRVYTGVLWRFRTTVPLRQRIKKIIDEGNYKHWYVFDKFGDVPAFGIPIEYLKHDKTPRKRQDVQKSHD